MADEGHPTALAALAVLTVVGEDALAAYRTIFGRSCWNSRDREAFRRFENALTVSREIVASLGEQSQNPNDGTPPDPP